jgi:hypothetical protein
VVRLAVRVKRRVEERFGVALQPEPTFVGFGADPDVEYLRGNMTPSSPSGDVDTAD